MQYIQDKRWYRARVKKIIEPEETYEMPVSSYSDEKRLVHSSEMSVEVYYIDFGNTEVVPVSR